MEKQQTSQQEVEEPKDELSRLQRIINEVKFALAVAGESHSEGPVRNF
jgi:hypothetical protein